VIVLAYGEEPWLDRCLSALAGEDADLVVVDNGCTRTSLLAEWERRARVTVVRPGRNLGYAGGCNAGARAATGQTLVFVNSDAVVQPGAVAELAKAVSQPEVGLACASIRLADEPGRLNSTGNPFHYLGVVWAGHFGEPAGRYDAPADVATVTGAAFAVRREVWDSLGGFAEEWFAYHEDSELSLRAWQRGWRVRYEPAAVVHHHYEFSRNPFKSYLIERNRLLNLLTLYELRTLLVLLPALASFELLMLALSLREGWVAEKLRGYAWIVRHFAAVRRRRRGVQSARLRRDRELAPMWAGRLVFANLAAPTGLGAVNAVLDAYWRVARRLL
jgi:GT2 family glycosyltransferase